MNTMPTNDFGCPVGDDLPSGNFWRSLMVSLVLCIVLFWIPLAYFIVRALA